APAVQPERDAVAPNRARHGKPVSPEVVSVWPQIPLHNLSVPCISTAPSRETQVSSPAAAAGSLLSAVWAARSPTTDCVVGRCGSWCGGTGSAGAVRGPVGGG